MSQTELLEKLVARVAELEKDNDHQRERRNAARDCIKKMQKEQDALILRKQAEAVDSMAEELKQSNRYEKPEFKRGMATAYGFATGAAERLRQQADELDRAGGEHV